MKTKLKKYIKEIAIFFIIITISSNAISLYKSQSLTGEVLPLESVKLINNKIYDIKNDKPILVHIWATWCPVCKVEAPNIQTISEHFNVISIAVKSGSNEKLRNWLKDNDYTYNVINDEQGQLSSMFNITAFPTTLIYDKNKKLIFGEVGYTSTVGLWLRMLWASSQIPL